MPSYQRRYSKEPTGVTLRAFRWIYRPSLARYRDIRFACEQDVEFIALSFTRQAKDILEVRKMLDELGAILISLPRLKTCRDREY